MAKMTNAERHAYNLERVVGIEADLVRLRTKLVGIKAARALIKGTIPNWSDNCQIKRKRGAPPLERCNGCYDCVELAERSIAQLVEAREGCVAEAERAILDGEASAWAQKMHKALHGGVEAALEARRVSHEDVPAWYMGDDQ